MVIPVETLNDVTRAYVGAMSSGVRPFVSNISSTIETLEVERRILPLTISSGGYGDAWVTAPHTAYALYAAEETRMLPNLWVRPPLWLFARAAGLWLRSFQFNDVVTVGNWMLSTNLYAEWRPSAVGDLSSQMADRFPKHFIGIRSLNAWSDEALLVDLRGAGWTIVPSRQIWVVDDPKTDWKPRRDAKRDRALLDAAGARIERFEVMTDEDAARIAELYGLLYLGKYSRLNPAYTPSWIKLTHGCGMIRYRGVRGAEGQLETVVGCFAAGGTISAPIVGYDTVRPPEDGLYRMATQMILDQALEGGFRVNLSGGAATFKRNRGSKRVVEYSAYFARHLSSYRRRSLDVLAQGLTRHAVPMMERLEL
jgi:hypothetical protein